MNTRRGTVRRLLLIALLGALLAGPGCLSKYHTVGVGATGGQQARAGQWYAFWGLLPLETTPDVRSLAHGRVNYSVWTGFSTWDCLLNLLTAPLGFVQTSLHVEY